MNNWEPIKTFIKFSVKGITPSYVEHSSIIVLNQKCIRNNQIDFSLAQYTDDTRKISKDKFLQEGDLIINSTGTGTAGRCAFVDKLPEGYNVIVDSHILILRCHTYNQARCLSYILYSFEERLMSFMTGSSGQGELDKVVLLNLKTNLTHSLVEQEKMASILSTIDSKIELNNKINLELEAMAKTLYDYWFVQFDFPDENGKPYKTSGGEMVWSEELKREIPKGWKAETISKVAKENKDQLNPMDYPGKDFNHYSIPAFDELGTYKREKGEEIRSNKFIIKKLDILVSKLNPWFNRVIYSTDDTDLISSTEFVVWRAENIPLKNYLYMLARDESFITHCIQSASGTSNSHKRVNPKVMMRYRLPYNKETMEKFGEIIGATVKMFTKNQIEKNELVSLRDWLLPMLMNGQVTVE